MRCIGITVALVLVVVPGQADEGGESGWHALLVGCTEYPVLKERLGAEHYEYARIELAGPANDVAEMRRTLMDLFQVPEERITVLVGWTGTPPERRPTYGNIVAQLDRLAKVAKKGDRVLVHMAGHGCQVPDADGDEMDGLDEVFLPADVSSFDRDTGTVPCVLTDDELGAKVRQIRDAGATVWLIMDCCHSGTMVRGAERAGVRMRQLDPELLGVPTAASRGAPAEGDASLSAGEIDKKGLDRIVAMYGAQSYRPAPEMPLPRSGPREQAKQHGLLTYMILSRLRRAGGNVTFAELHEQVLAAYEALPFTGTVPLAEGDLRLSVFGEGRHAGPVLLVQREGEKVALNAGQLAGIGPKTVLAVYEPLKPGDPKALLGGVEVITADPVRSFCRPVELDGKMLPRLEPSWRCPAEVRRLPAGDLRLKVAAVDAERRELPRDKVPEAVLELFGANEAIFALVSPSEAKWSLVVDGDTTWLEPAQGAKGLRLAAEPDLLDSLHRIYRAENLMFLAGSAGAATRLPPGLEVRMLRIDAEGESAVPSGSVLRPGDRIKIVLRNGTGRVVDLTLLLIDAHYGVTAAWPQGGESVRLTAADRAERQIGPLTVNDRPLGTERLLVIAVPRAEDDPVVDLTFLEQDPLEARMRKGGETGIARALRALAFGDARGVGVREAGPAELGISTIVWRTEWAPLRAPERPEKTGIALRAGNVLDLFTDIGRGSWHQPASDQTTWRGSLGELYARMAPSIVVVRTRIGHGTGFVIDGQHVITNHHVVAGGHEYTRAGRPLVGVHRGRLGADGTMALDPKTLPAEVVLSDQERDLALLHMRNAVALEGARPVPLVDTDPKPGQSCVMIGHPGSALLWNVRNGHISGVGLWPEDGIDAIMLRLSASEERRAALREQLAGMRQRRIAVSSCGSYPGDSGGPLLDEQGRLLAVTYAYNPGDRIAYHVHIEEVRGFLAERPKPGQALPPAVPDPWATGPRVFMRQSASGMHGVGPFDLLIAQQPNDDPRLVTSQIFIDVDEDSETGDGSEESAVRLLRSRTFDAEIVIHVLLDRTIVFYDTWNKGPPDLVLVDFQRDNTADVAFELQNGKWVFRPDVSVPMVSSDHLRFAADRESRAKVITKLKALTGR